LVLVPTRCDRRKGGEGKQARKGDAQLHGAS
jgi:hypothetical protein